MEIINVASAHITMLELAEHKLFWVRLSHVRSRLKAE